LQAVETIDGPVMVLAGPGTGKTQVLAFRIAEILQQTDVHPRNILALTFTESGVVAMRERLVSLIGVTAYGVGIYTFHSFANRVINDAGAEFYKSHSLDPIDDITQLKLIIRLIDEVNNERLRPIRAPYFYVKPIIHSIKSLKNEGVSPDRLRTLCREEITTLETSDESISKSGKNKGGLKQSVKDKIERLERSAALADIYERYEAEITERGLYDYEDMILFVIKSFQENPSLKAQYQEQFQYILVDEYQDTNNAQNTLVRSLCDYFESPNLFVVGDDKQSIYRFQGASMANLLNFLEWYPDATLISLRQNYRSGQPILDNAHTLISSNTEQLTKVIPSIHSELTAQFSEAKVIFTPYTTADKEALGVVQGIKALLAQGVKASEISVIYRENSEAASFTDLLARQGIPFHLEAGNNVLKDPDVRQLLNILELTHNPDNEMALFRLLHAPYSGIETRDLITLGRWRKQQRTTWTKLLAGDCPETDVPINDWSCFQTLKHKVEAWHRYSLQHNLGDTVEHVFLDSGFLAHVMQQHDHMDRLHRVRCFFDEIKSIMTSVNFATLDDLFERLEIRQTYNLALIPSPLSERSDDAIRLMTSHKSKGLEFEYVFVPHFYDGLWSNGRKSELISLPEGIVPHHQESDEQAIQEERRLFYVALTRAKKAVFLSYSELDAANKKLLPCQFLTELNSVTTAAPVATNLMPITAFFSPIQTHFVEETSKAYLRDIVTKQSITPTGLNTFLTCPLEYLYKDVYCIPGVREAFQAYGTAIHKALEMWGNWSKTGAHDFGLASILSVFTETLVKEGLTQDEVNRYQRLGEDVLTAYYQEFALGWVPPLATEYSFTPHGVLLDGRIPITGKIDKIEPIKGSKHVRVIDYKTGRVKSRNEIEGNTASSDGDYKRQLVFYAVLAESDPFFPYTIGECALSFIDDQKKFTTEVFEITKQEKDELRELIRNIYAEITSLNFIHTPHKQSFNKGESLCDLLRSDMLTGLPATPASMQESAL
ncbi:MAG TPA: UvrD-helicase domain-containing protein, partial [Patescibacteria group bacterium]